MFKYHSDMGHCFSYVVVVSKESKKKNVFFFVFFLLLFFLEKRCYGHGIGKKDSYFQLGMGPKFRP